MSKLDKPDIDEVQVTYCDERGRRWKRRVLPLEIFFDAPVNSLSGDWKVKVYDVVSTKDHDILMQNIHSWQPAK